MLFTMALLQASLNCVIKLNVNTFNMQNIINRLSEETYKKRIKK